MTRHMCGYVLDDWALCVHCTSSGWKSGPAGWTWPYPSHSPSYMCNFVLPLIGNRALPQSSCYKEQLFPFWLCVQVCVATATSYPWVFPLMLSSRLIPYRKLITDWLGSCFPLISHGPAWGSVLRDWLKWDQEQKACCSYMGSPHCKASATARQVGGSLTGFVFLYLELKYWSYHEMKCQNQNEIISNLDYPNIVFCGNSRKPVTCDSAVTVYCIILVC